jgi:hypothetical protein
MPLEDQDQLAYFTCQHCAREIRARRTQIGKRIVCPKCGQHTVVQLPQSVHDSPPLLLHDLDAPPSGKKPAPADKLAERAPAAGGLEFRLRQAEDALEQADELRQAAEERAQQEAAAAAKLRAELQAQRTYLLQQEAASARRLSEVTAILELVERLSLEDPRTREALQAVQSGKIVKNRFGMEPGRLLAMQLGASLMGLPVRADVYGKNGFRFLAVPAHLEPSQLRVERERLCRLVHERRREVVRSFLRTSYDGHLRVKLEPCLEALSQPKQRLIRELFWPHLSPEVFKHLQAERTLTARATFIRVLQHVRLSQGQEQVRARHALAVCYHNLALAHELAYGTGHLNAPDDHWKEALSCWREVLETEAFWEYLAERIECLGAREFGPETIPALRADLPSVLLGFHGLFSRSYAQAGEHAASHRHLDYMRLIA